MDYILTHKNTPSKIKRHTTFGDVPFGGLFALFPDHKSLYMRIEDIDYYKYDDCGIAVSVNSGDVFVISLNTEVDIYTGKVEVDTDAFINRLGIEK